jgi:hypothetical protein
MILFAFVVQQEQSFSDSQNIGEILIYENSTLKGEKLSYK